MLNQRKIEEMSVRLINPADLIKFAIANNIKLYNIYFLPNPV